MTTSADTEEKTAAGTLPGDGGSARLRNEKGAAVPCAGRYARQAADRATRGERGAMGEPDGRLFGDVVEGPCPMALRGLGVQELEDGNIERVGQLWRQFDADSGA